MARAWCGWPLFSRNVFFCCCYALSSLSSFLVNLRCNWFTWNWFLVSFIRFFSSGGCFNRNEKNRTIIFYIDKKDQTTVCSSTECSRVESCWNATWLCAAFTARQQRQQQQQHRRQVAIKILKKEKWINIYCLHVDWNGEINDQSHSQWKR